MSFSQLFAVYPNRNAELRAVAKQCYEFGRTVAQAQSAAMSSGLLQADKDRQLEFVAYALRMVKSLHDAPIPDMPATHPISFDIDMTKQYDTFTTDVASNQVPLNEATELVAEYWMITAVELAKSQSASLAGSLTDKDYARAEANLGTLKKLLEAMTGKPDLDLAETAEPGSNYGVPNAKK